MVYRKPLHIFDHMLMVIMGHVFTVSIMGIARHAIAVTKELLLLADDGSPLAEYAVYVL